MILEKKSIRGFVSRTNVNEYTGGEYMIPSEKTTEDELTEKNAAAEFIKHIDEVFSTRQARQKPLLSKLLTAKLAEEIEIVGVRTIRQAFEALIT